MQAHQGAPRVAWVFPRDWRPTPPAHHPLPRPHLRRTLPPCFQPSNVLLNSECLVKMADFGLARSVAQLAAEEGNPVLTDYVATRWYRAPEILLSSMRYTYGVDMWACGEWAGEMRGEGVGGEEGERRLQTARCGGGVSSSVST